MKIEMFSKDDCPYCAMAKEYLTTRNIPFTETKLNDDGARNQMYDHWRLEGVQRSVPQVIVDGERIGGYYDLIRSDVVDRFNAGQFDAEF